MRLSLIINGSYEMLYVGLFNEEILVQQIVGAKNHSSTSLIPYIKNILEDNKISLADIAYIALNNGPGPFTTIRTVVASINGINFTHRLPLIGVNSLTTLLHEYTSNEWPITIALLNAFTQDVYVGIQTEQNIAISCKNIELLLKEIKDSSIKTPIRFIGNGTALHRDRITTYLGARAYIPELLPLETSLGAIAHVAQNAWKQGNFCHQIIPHYLKQLSYKKSISA